MPNSYVLKDSITIKLEDGGTQSLTLRYYGDVPDLPDVLIDAPFRVVNDRGTFSHIEEDDDSLDFTDFEMTIDNVDSQVSANKHELEQWFNEHKASDGVTDLVSTNDGNAQARKLTDNTKVNVGLRSDYFTISFKILFDNGVSGKAFGRHYKYFQPISASVSSAEDSQITIRGRILGTYEEITTI